MSGNVFEWVQDKFPLYGNAVTDNPKNERSGARRVFRGSGWLINSGYLRCSDRNFGRPSFK